MVMRELLYVAEEAVWIAAVPTAELENRKSGVMAGASDVMKSGSSRPDTRLGCRTG